jgi:uncharacterized membrane protein
LEDFLTNTGRLTRIAQAVLKHVHSNAATYIALIGALAQNDYVAALACLKVLILRLLIGGIQQKLERRKKDMTAQSKNNPQQ